MSAPTELLHKLQIKAGSRLWLINVPQAVAEEITAGAEVEPVHEKDEYDGALVFIESVRDIEALTPRILAEMPPDGLLWMAYRKGPAAKESGLNRDKGWDALDQAGWRPVRQVAIDDEWSAVRFRPKALVKAKAGSRFA
ncbi:MAG: hypothetical protein ABS76_16375 [Pelagibacterium sp. SCN 64-44]|nr:MAG: hypothetical protein ABS76_16375 [Pelagibacterium sp. SCN 64-44]